MAVTARMACQFSSDGKYFAQLSTEGKLKIWNTFSNSFEQEFTPDYQLTSSCTCLHFLHTDASSSKAGSPRKKKRKESQSESNTYIALGTSSGLLLIYSLTKADLDYTIDSRTSQSINCLSTNDDSYIYSGADSNILIWNLYKRNISSKWSAANEKICSILVIPDRNRLLTAAKNIKLWDISSKEVLKTFTGHSSQVTVLHYISPKDSTTDDYVISGSKGDRLLNCWNLNETLDGKNAIASFLMEDIVNSLSVYISPDGSTSIAATVRSGVIHVYQHTLNGKGSKPLKPKTTIQVVSDSREDVVVVPIHIAAALHRDAETLCICYGSAVVQIFENITISTYKKLQCLLREDLHKVNVSKQNQVSKVRSPIVGNDVHYLTSQTSNIPNKRKNEGQREVPMEKRLENLMLNEADSASKVPKANNVAQLLVQGLHSKDKNILKTVLFKKDEQLIKNTIKRLPITAIVPLFEELTKFIQGKTLSRKLGLMWLKNLILIHSGLLLSNPDLPNFFGEALGSIEAEIALQTPRNKLMGRLELLVSQVSVASTQETTEDNEAVLVFTDRVGSDSDNDGVEIEVHSNSENEWDEESTADENEKDDSNNEDDSDEPMSS